MSGSAGGIAKRTVRRLNAVSQTTASVTALRRTPSDLRVFRHRVLCPHPAEDIACRELSARDAEHVARDPRRLVRAEVDRRRGDVVRDADTIQRIERRAVSPLLV